MKDSELTALLEELRPELVAIATQKVGDPDEGEDLVQEVYTGVWRNRDKIRAEEAREYIGSSLHNRIRNRWRNDARESRTLNAWPRDLETDHPMPLADPEGDDPLSLLLAGERTREIERVLEIHLTEYQRWVLEAYYLEGRSMVEIIEESPYHRANVYRKKAAALETLREELDHA